MKPLIINLANFNGLFFSLRRGREGKWNRSWSQTRKNGEGFYFLDFFLFFFIVSDFWSWTDCSAIDITSFPLLTCVSSVMEFSLGEHINHEKSNHLMPQSRAELKCSVATKIPRSFSFKSIFCF